MDKRLMKRHKRQVERAREQIRVSEPDVRTPEELRAAREAGRPAAAQRNGPVPLYATPGRPAAVPDDSSKDES